MDIVFKGQTLSVRQLKNRQEPSKFKLDDLVLNESNGQILEVKTVQTDCPVWSKFENHARKTVVIFESGDGVIIPVNGISGLFIVFRRRSMKGNK